jgi:hypothetical protein
MKSCWCTLSSHLNQRIILSVITFDYTATDMKCADIGFYLRADAKQDQECAVLRKDRYYISSSNNLYLNFQPKSWNPNRKFWIIYEGSYTSIYWLGLDLNFCQKTSPGSDNQAKVQLKCGHISETMMHTTLPKETKLKINLFSATISTNKMKDPDAIYETTPTIRKIPNNTDAEQNLIFSKLKLNNSSCD